MNRGPRLQRVKVSGVLVNVMFLRWKVRQLGVNIAYLKADLEEETFIELPEGFHDSRRNLAC